jgi:hypothetical protein
MNSPNLRLVVIDHPLGDVDGGGLTARAQAACDSLLAYLRGAPN